jgi:transposase-like protein
MAHSRNADLEQFWRRHLRRQAQSGLSIRGYCRRHGLADASFHHWRRTIRQRDGQSRTGPSHARQSDFSATPAFLPVALIDPPAPAASSPIDIHLGGGRRIRVRSGCDRQLLADVLAILAARNAAARAAAEDRPC